MMEIQMPGKTRQAGRHTYTTWRDRQFIGMLNAYSRLKTNIHCLSGHLRLFLSAYLDSSLVGYYTHHTNQLQVMELPIPMPCDLLDETAAQQVILDLVDRKLNVGFVEVDPYIAAYFCLTDQELICIEDTKNIHIVGHSEDKADEVAIGNYAKTICKTLNEWSQDYGGEGGLYCGGKCYGATAVVALRLGKKPTIDDEVVSSFDNGEDISIYKDTIYIRKPLTIHLWTRTMAISDAAIIYTEYS